MIHAKTMHRGVVVILALLSARVVLLRADSVFEDFVNKSSNDYFDLSLTAKLL